jgi:hypothetical protein
MPAHLDLLESKSKDVRVAAGENVALMYECAHTFKKTSASLRVLRVIISF